VRFAPEMIERIDKAQQQIKELELKLNPLPDSKTN
jgi:hypothetical protein